MRKRTAFLFLFIFGLCAAANRSWALSDLCAEVDSTYDKGQYERVEILALRYEPIIDSLPATEQVTIYLKTGFAMIMLNRESDARRYFTKVLDVNPATVLDPVRISPIFRSVFDDVKAAYRPKAVHNSPDENFRFRKPQTMLMNLVLPGSGHWTEGRKARGGAVAGLQLITAGLLIAQMDQLHRSRENYIHMTDRAQVGGAYDDYYHDTRLAWIAGIAACAVYLGSQVELTLTPPPVVKSGTPTTFIGVIPTSDGASFQIAVRR